MTLGEGLGNDEDDGGTNGRRTYGMKGGVLDGDEESKEITDEDKYSEPDILGDMEKLVFFDDLDQRYKGSNFEFIGRIEGQGKER
jgi:hypothetical protein